MPLKPLFISLVVCAIIGQADAQTKVKWSLLGPVTLPQYGVDSGAWSANGMGWIESLAVFEKKPKFLYAGSNTGGLYRSKNYGKTWKFAFDIDRVCGVNDIVIDKDNRRQIWVATGTTTFDYDWGHGVIHSTNGGKSWQTTGLNFAPHEQIPLWCLRRSDVNPDLFFACSETDIYRTKDGCVNWDTVYDEAQNARVHFRHLALHNTDVNKVVATGDKIMISGDGGETWSDRSYLMSYHLVRNKYDSLPDRYALAVNPNNNDQLMVLYEYAGYNYIERSDDFGNSWKLIVKNRSFNRVDRNHAEIAFHPTDTNIIIVAGVRVYISTDGGKKFDTSTQPAYGAANEQHDDVRHLVVLSDGTIYTGNDGGVGMSTDNGKTWKNISGKGLSVGQFFDIAVSEKGLVGGCQDLSSMLYQNGVWTNTSEIYGDGGCNLIRGDEVFVMQSGLIRKGGFHNKEWEMISVPFIPNRFSYPFIFSPNDTNAIWATDHHIWSYDLGHRHWKKLTADIPPVLTKIVALDVHLASGRVYFAKDQPTWDPTESGLKERLYVGETDVNGNYVWKDITSTLGILAWREITGIAINPNDVNEVYVSLYGYDGADLRFKVFRTLDGGSSWENISEGLPDLNTFCIKFWNNHLLLGTDGGVYHRFVSDDKWVLFSGKLPNTHISDIEIEPFTGMIYVATYGNGVWKMKISKKW